VEQKRKLSEESEATFVLTTQDTESLLLIVLIDESATQPY